LPALAKWPTLVLRDSSHFTGAEFHRLAREAGSELYFVKPLPLDGLEASLNFLSGA
jgi:hypothetical protein